MFATRDKAAELIKLGSLGIQNQITNSIAAVINTYYNIVRQKQMIKAIDEQMALSSERAKLAQYKLDIGVGAKPDVLQAKIDNNAQRALQLEQEATMRQLKEQLIQLLNLKAPASFDVSDCYPDQYQSYH
jgi:outer membrane protein TolC